MLSCNPMVYTFTVYLVALTKSSSWGKEVGELTKVCNKICPHTPVSYLFIKETCRRVSPAAGKRNLIDFLINFFNGWQLYPMFASQICKFSDVCWNLSIWSKTQFTWPTLLLPLLFASFFSPDGHQVRLLQLGFCLLVEDSKMSLPCNTSEGL